MMAQSQEDEEEQGDGDQTPAVDAMQSQVLGPVRANSVGSINSTEVAGAERGVRTLTVADRRCMDISMPRALLLAILLGIVTASTGLYIAINSEFLNDLRFGYCAGLPLTDRNRCCGGRENIDHKTGQCKHAGVQIPGMSDAKTHEAVDWVPWASVAQFPFFVYLLATVTFAATASLLVGSFAPAAKGSGIPDVKAAVSGFSNNGNFSAMCLLMKSVGLSLAVGAGLSLGKEGPLIHVGVCWAHVLQQSTGLLGRFASTVPLHEVVCVGAAAGVSTAFGAPVGGVLFAIEELGSVRALSQRTLMLAFAGSFAASFMLKSWNLDGSNQLTIFKLSTPTNSPSKEWITAEIPLFLLLGVLGGLIGGAFVKANLKFARCRRRRAASGRSWLLPERWQRRCVEYAPSGCTRRCRQAPVDRSSAASDASVFKPLALHVLDASLIAVGTAVLNYSCSEFLRLPMVEVIHGLFETCPNDLSSSLGLCDTLAKHGFVTDSHLQASLLISAVLRFVETAVTFGSMLPSGLFVPSLYIGAVTGRLLGLWTLELTRYFDLRTIQINPGAFAMVGAVAVLSGFARMTVSLVVIMLELTGEINYAVPFMCAVLAAKLVGDCFTASIYDETAILLGYAVIEEPTNLRLSPCVHDVATPCGKRDVLDVATHFRLKALVELLCPEESGASAETVTADHGVPQCRQDHGASASSWSRGGGAMSHSRVQPLEVLVLTSRSERQVVGVVRRRRLRRWLAKGQFHADDLGSFLPVTTDLCNQEVEGGGNGGQQPRVIDLSRLVESGAELRRLLASAPLLTAVCAFREFPALRYIVCRAEHDAPESGFLSILTRDSLEAALQSGKFPAAFVDKARSAREVTLTHIELELAPLATNLSPQHAGQHLG